MPKTKTTEPAPVKQGRGRPKRKYASKRLWLDVPLSKKNTLDFLSDSIKMTRTNILVNMIQQASKDFKETGTVNMEGLAKEIRFITTFANDFVKEHAAEGADQEELRARGIKQYYALAEVIHKVKKQNNTETGVISMDGLAEDIRKLNEFVKGYIQEHYGNEPHDEEEAHSKALEAYYRSEGYNFGDDDDSFILPDQE